MEGALGRQATNPRSALELWVFRQGAGRRTSRGAKVASLPACCSVSRDRAPRFFDKVFSWKRRRVSGCRAYSSVGRERTPDKREVGGSNPPRPTSSRHRLRGCSSVGRAPALQAGCRRFDSDQLHWSSILDPSVQGAVSVAARPDSDNRIRRVRRASHSEVFAGFRSPKGLDLDLERGVARAVRLGRPEFRVTKLLRACGGCLGSRRR